MTGYDPYCVLKTHLKGSEDTPYVNKPKPKDLTMRMGTEATKWKDVGDYGAQVLGLLEEYPTHANALAEQRKYLTRVRFEIFLTDGSNLQYNLQ
jgi:hypothetical protein